MSAAVVTTAVARRCHLAAVGPWRICRRGRACRGVLRVIRGVHGEDHTRAHVRTHDRDGLTKDIIDWQRKQQFGRLLIEVDPMVWDIAAGVILELVRADVEVHVDPLLVRLYGPPFRASGDEDTLLSIAGPAKHEAVMKQDGRRLVTSVNRVSVSVDGFLP